MVAVVIGLILILTVAAGIMAMVAAPHLRQGEDLLTPEGKQTIMRAGQRTREQSAAAAENTVQAVASLKDKVSSAWSPARDLRPERMDRLEGQEPGTDRPGDENAQPGENLTSSPAAEVGGPRPVPAESGPIPLEESSRSSPGRSGRPGESSRT